LVAQGDQSDQPRSAKRPQIAEPIPKKAVVGRGQQDAESERDEQPSTLVSSARKACENQGRQRKPSDELGVLGHERGAPQLTIEQRRPEQLHVVENRG
jgi:hypothetical protein